LSFSDIASLSKLLVPSLNALVIRRYHAIHMSIFMLGSNTGFKCCIQQHSLCFLLYSRQCTSHAEHITKAAVH
jgi:hypothetical protein